VFDNVLCRKRGGFSIMKKDKNEKIHSTLDMQILVSYRSCVKVQREGIF